MRMPDSSNKHTCPSKSVTLQRCCSGSVGMVVDGGKVVVVVGEPVVGDEFTLTTILEAFAPEWSNENPELFSPLKAATTDRRKHKQQCISQWSSGHRIHLRCGRTQVQISPWTVVLLGWPLRYDALGRGCSFLQCLGRLSLASLWRHKIEYQLQLG